MKNILEVNDLRVRYRTKGVAHALLTRDPDPFIDAVMGVSFSIRPGEIYGLVGESGSGKTTVARGIMGLAPAHSGDIRFEGETLTSHSNAAFHRIRRKTAMMFQDPVGSLSPRLTIRSIITEPLKIHHTQTVDLKAAANRFLEMVNLPPSLARRHPHQLSGGQARRVGIARALALNPRLIIADEPTAGLDVSVQGEILNLMGQLTERREVSFLVITHNLAVVRHISDRMAVMYLGRFLEQGKTDEIFSKMRHPYTKALLSAHAKPDLKGHSDRIVLTGEIPSLVHRPAGCEFHTRCPFVQDKCRKEFPEKTEVPPDHAFFCHFPIN